MSPIPCVEFTVKRFVRSWPCPTMLLCLAGMSYCNRAKAGDPPDVVSERDAIETVAYTVEDGGAQIAVRSADDLHSDVDTESKAATLRALVDHLGGDLRMWPGQEGARQIVFFIPGGRFDGSTGSIG